MVAGLCLVLALGSALGAKRTAKPERTVPIAVAARSLPAGHVLARADVTVARWPARLRPAGTRAGPADLVGERLAGPIGRGEPLTLARVVGKDLTAGLASGTVAVPLPLADGTVAQLLHPGDYVDVLTSPDAPARAVSTVARHVLVLAVLADPDGTDALTGARVIDLVVAMDRAGAARIAGSESSQKFTAVAEPP